jgi:uncharacterized tellurite resistance protein B-like protein
MNAIAKTITAEQTAITLRALKMVAMADGHYHDLERKMLEETAKSFSFNGDLEGLEPTTEAQVAAAVVDPAARTRLIQMMMLVALMDKSVTGEERDVINRFATALGVDEPRVKNLNQFVDGHLTQMKWDLMNRGYIGRHVLRSAWKTEGFKGIWKAIAPHFGAALDPELAWRYRQLGLLPEGTLGRAYWEYATRRKFSFPGEAYGFEWRVFHDLGHVLSGYETNPKGEIEQASFEAGYQRRDAFYFVFSVVMMFHLGVELYPDKYQELTQDSYDPERARRAYERGVQVNTDLSQWNYWDSMELPIDEVRRRLNIVPPL